MRFLPHLNNTGGFFVAVLHKVHEGRRSIQRKQEAAADGCEHRPKERGKTEHVLKRYQGNAIQEAQEEMEEAQGEKEEEENMVHRDMEGCKRNVVEGSPLREKRGDAARRRRFLAGDELGDAAGGNSSCRPRTILCESNMQSAVFGSVSTGVYREWNSKRKKDLNIFSHGGSNDITVGIHKEIQPHEVFSLAPEGTAASDRRLPLQMQLDFVGLGWQEGLIRSQHEQHLQKLMCNTAQRERKEQGSTAVVQHDDSIMREQLQLNVSADEEDERERIRIRVIAEGTQKRGAPSSGQNQVRTTGVEQHETPQRGVRCALEHHATQGGSKLKNLETRADAPPAMQPHATALPVQSCYFNQEKLEASWRAACDSLGLRNAALLLKTTHGFACADSGVVVEELALMRHLLQALRESLYVRRVDIKRLPQDDTCPDNVNSSAAAHTLPSSTASSCDQLIHQKHVLDLPPEGRSQSLKDDKNRFRYMCHASRDDGATQCSDRKNSPICHKRFAEKETPLRVVSLVSAGVNRALRGVSFSRYKVISAGCVAFQCRNSHTYRVGYGGTQWTVPAAERIQEAHQRVEQLHLQQTATASTDGAMPLPMEKGEVGIDPSCLVAEKYSLAQHSVHSQEHQKEAVGQQRDFRVVLYVEAKVMEILLRVQANATRVEWAALEHLPGAKALKEQTAEGPLLLVTKIGKGGRLMAPGWRGKTQLELMIDQHTREALLRLVLRDSQY